MNWIGGHVRSHPGATYSGGILLFVCAIIPSKIRVEWSAMNFCTTFLGIGEVNAT